MEVYEITGYQTGVSQAGVNYLQPGDSFQNIFNGYIYRQVLQSRKGVGYFGARLAGGTRILGIFEHTLPDATKELLAFDTNHLYKFNTGTGNFDQIPFGGSLFIAGYAGFGISVNDGYISGTSYPAAPLLSGGGANPAYTGANQGARFVFTSPAIQPKAGGTSSIFFYNGTDVQDFTNTSDNPNYAAPPQGALNYANYVLWFNERLNFIAPTIAGIDYNQGVLYSGIRTSNGNGDKYNVPGSGLFQADTYQNITGASILGQVIALNFDRMDYTLERTTDAFNPYFGRTVPSVLGTNAKFSAVAWSNIIRSMGRTGIIEGDGRKSLRADNKIPYFTADDIDGVDFNLTYGGFDRSNGQFLWAYKESEADTDTQNKVLVGNYEEDTWSINDQRFSVFGQTDLGLNLTWDDIEAASGNESWAQWDTTEEIWDRIGLGLATQKTLAGDDLGFIYELNQDYDDYISNISAIGVGATTTLTVTASAFQAGDQVTVSDVEGMTELNNYDPATNEMIGNLYTVVSATPTSVVINVDSTNFTAYTAGGQISKPIAFYAETIPFNPYREQGRRVYVSHVELLIDTNGGSITLDAFADQQTTAFKAGVLCQPNPGVQQNSDWVTCVIDQEANFITFALRQTSPGVQVRLTSMRIHAQVGGMTSG